MRGKVRVRMRVRVGVGMRVKVGRRVTPREPFSDPLNSHHWIVRSTVPAATWMKNLKVASPPTTKPLTNSYKRGQGKGRA